MKATYYKKTHTHTRHTEQKIRTNDANALNYRRSGTISQVVCNDLDTVVLPDTDACKSENSKFPRSCEPPRVFAKPTGSHSFPRKNFDPLIRLLFQLRSISDVLSSRFYQFPPKFGFSNTWCGGGVIFFWKPPWMSALNSPKKKSGIGFVEQIKVSKAAKIPALRLKLHRLFLTSVQ